MICKHGHIEYHKTNVQILVVNDINFPRQWVNQATNTRKEVIAYVMKASVWHRNIRAHAWHHEKQLLHE